MELVIESLRQPPVSQREVELVERKGIGHPDTICDNLVEAISRALARLYVERLGAIAHYNIDKALLVAGQCAKGFGYGRIVRPMELIVGDRATFTHGAVELPIEETVARAVDDWVAGHLPHVRPGIDLCTRLALAPGSNELRGIFEDSSKIVSNDTCGASGYAPLTPTEQLVLDIERFLNGQSFKAELPDTGQDVKVFAVRRHERLSVTIAMPLLCREVSSERRYFDRKEEILGRMATEFRSAPLAIDWGLNCLDQPGAGEAGVYLTVSGTSAEDADSGQVGRGNRANGLIAFARPTGGEATAGKNPLAHTGKIYSILSYRLAREIHCRCAGLEEVYVHLAARIGQPVDEPWAAVQVVPSRGAAAGDFEPLIRQVVAAELARFDDFRKALLRGDYPVC